MKVIEFNSLKGIYNFELQEIKTIFHAHPAMEILCSENGGIKIETPIHSFENISFAIVDKNVRHKVIFEKGILNVVMVEATSDSLAEILNQFDIRLNHGIYVDRNTTDKINLMHRISVLLNQKVIRLTKDLRVQECLNYLNSNSSDYKQMIGFLKLKTNLSESRLSHIFKNEIGISLKKYLVWSRLKKAFQLVTSNNVNMYEATLQSGFYDQAHLSKAFKQMFGLSPSVVYNSRMLQD